ncbi:MAG: AI-2E family transporter [Ruminococcaceae bacterium]|nr:AI-2E family transporter [Oscillospiraceae bacterium]
MDQNKQSPKFKYTLLLVALGAIILAAAWHFKSVLGFFSTIFDFLSPAILGFVIAFILNVPMSAFERLFAHIQKKRNKKVTQNRNTILALVITLILAATVIGLIIWGIVPLLIDSIKTAVVSVRANYPHALAFMESHGIETDQIKEFINSFNLNDLAVRIQKDLEQIVKVSYTALSSVLSSIFVYFTSFILSIYMLTSKHHTKEQFNRLLGAVCSPAIAQKTRHVLSLSYRCFRNFIAGQCLEALILGTMFFIVLSLMRMPYTFLISVLIAVTAIIPYVGAFIGFFVGGIMILMTDPVKALIFAVTFLVIQQLEEQLVYPRVVGKYVGLPPVWALSALLIGGQIGGILGMLTFIPLTSILYALTREYVISKETAAGSAPTSGGDGKETADATHDTTDPAKAIPEQNHS